jgi:sulfur carrier protein ThiS adenylyltransferase
VITELRYSRQQDLVPQDRLANVEVTVIGVGAIGRQTAIQLALIGTPRIQLIDFDTVEPVNLATQGYLPEDLGQTKVEATAQLIQRISDSIQVDLVHDRYRSKYAVGDAVFCCVDSIESRSAIWRSAGGRCAFWSDGRMLGEVIRVLVATREAGRDHYETTLFHPSEAQAGSCTSRSTIYTASIAAGLMVHQFARWLRGLPVDRDLSLNLLSSELAGA